MQLVSLHSKVTAHTCMGTTGKSLLCSVGKTVSIRGELLDVVVCGFYIAYMKSFTYCKLLGCFSNTSTG